MKNLKKSIAVLIAALMLFYCFAASAFAAGTVTVTLRVEGIKNCFYYNTVTVNEGATVLDVLTQADKDSDSLTVTTVDSQYGAYVSAINGESEKTFKGWDGWLFRVNDVEPQVGVSAYTVSDSDSIVVYYGDPYGVGMQYPKINTSELENGKISFTSLDTVYDESFNPVQKENPVTGYTLTWEYNNGKTVTLTPDENGVCVVPSEYLSKGAHKVQIERYAANGCPTVLRLAPDFYVGEKNAQNLISDIFNKFKELINKIIEFIKSIFKK